MLGKLNVLHAQPRKTLNQLKFPTLLKLLAETLFIVYVLTIFSKAAWPEYVADSAEARPPNQLQIQSESPAQISVGTSDFTSVDSVGKEERESIHVNFK
jgi:hypothetical protein